MKLGHVRSDRFGLDPESSKCWPPGHADGHTQQHCAKRSCCQSKRTPLGFQSRAVKYGIGAAAGERVGIQRVRSCRCLDLL